MKKVLITGVTGMDGSTMSDYLLKNTDNIIVGGVRRLSVENHKNIEHLRDNERFRLIDLDVTDPINTEKVIKEEAPDYFINFAANSFVGNSWDMPINHMQTNFLPVIYQLEAIRKYVPNCRYYNAGSSEQFGNVDYSPQDITHPFKPRSPYGVSKCAAHNVVKVWRESYNLYAVQGILFNHEGVRRGEEFVTRKITKNVARIHKEIQEGKFPTPLELGNLDAKRDWSDSEDFVDGIWRMLNQENQPRMSQMCLPHFAVGKTGVEFDVSKASHLIKDYVLASGETHSIREFVEEAFEVAGIYKSDCHWSGEGLNEKYVFSSYNRGPEQHILAKINPKFYRPCEVSLLHGDATPAKTELGWEPKTSFKELVSKMVKNDYETA